VYDRILNEVPSDPTSMEDWLKFHYGIDQYYASTIQERKFMMSPVIATQENLVVYESLEVRQRICA
jgi:hypothetical protein